MDSEDAAPDPPSDSSRPNRRMRTATILTGVALGSLALSAVLFALPVSNPGVQSCGSPAWFLLQAHQDRALVETDGTLINGWDIETDRAKVQHAQDNRCSVKVAQRAVPAGVLLLVFWILTLVASIIGWTGRRALRSTHPA